MSFNKVDQVKNTPRLILKEWYFFESEKQFKYLRLVEIMTYGDLETGYRFLNTDGNSVYPNLLKEIYARITPDQGVEINQLLTGVSALPTIDNEAVLKNELQLEIKRYRDLEKNFNEVMSQLKEKESEVEGLIIDNNQIKADDMNRCMTYAAELELFRDYKDEFLIKVIKAIQN